MSTAQPPNQTKADEVPLEDIDKILAAEDPEFTKSLEEVRSVEVDKSVVIEASAMDESEVGAAAAQEEKEVSFVRRKINAFKLWMATWRLRMRARMVQFAKDALVWAKTKPKEYALFTFVMLKALAKNISIPVKAFLNASRLQKITVVLLIAVLAGTLWVMRANLKGIWIPHLTAPILADLGEHADFVETYDVKDGAESFYSAFPQEIHEYLFDKLKVNLKRTSNNPLPMGAFEVVVEVDSKDTAVELHDRRVEIKDELQRIIEEETVTDLEQTLGKERLKGRIKKGLNERLTQGWIKDVRYKTFVLKP